MKRILDKIKLFNKSQNKDIDTLIGVNTSIATVNIKSSNSLRIDGNIFGNIIADNDIIVGEKGNVIGNIICSNIITAGNIFGDICAENTVHLTETSIVKGDIKCNNIITDEGCNFEGNIKTNYHCDKNCINETKEEDNENKNIIDSYKKPKDEKVGD